MSFNFSQLTNQYYAQANHSTFPRLRGWEFLWDYVQSHSYWSDLIKPANIEKSALHLGFYLANWGMFRGSSGILNTNLDFFKDFLIHIFTKIPLEFWDLKFENFNPKHKDYAKSCKLFDDALNKIEKFKPDTISWTTTLKTKILLGLWGQCPAIDDYYKKGLSLFLEQNSQYKIKPKLKMTSQHLSDLFEIYEHERWNLNGYSTHYGEKKYPPGKVIDMAFFHYGLINS